MSEGRLSYRSKATQEMITGYEQFNSGLEYSPRPSSIRVDRPWQIYAGGTLLGTEVLHNLVQSSVVACAITVIQML